jgi:ribosomal protein L29
MKYKELVTKNQGELAKDLINLVLEEKDLNFKKKMGQLKQLHKLTVVRKDIARIKMILGASK